MLRVRRLGRVPYGEATVLQRALARRGRDDYVLVLEHPNVYTLGVSADPAHVLVDPESVGAELVLSDRGGDVTFHGPGQLVVYPICTLKDEPGAGPAHVERVERLVIETLEELGLPSVGRLAGYPGVWIEPDGARPRKIAAVGVRTWRVEGRRRSLHGVALNVESDLSMFSHIVPCGISQFAVTSLRSEGLQTSMDEVAEVLVDRAAAIFGAGRPVEVQAVKTGPAETASDRRSAVPVALSSPGLRRLSQAGVDASAALPLTTRKPPWLRLNARMGEDYLALKRTVRGLGLVTVCEEAGCPNIYECWNDGTATFMVNGERCTRACGFCNVNTAHPLPLDPGEPDRVAKAVEQLDLEHAVITCVARDDLADGGAGAIAATVRAIRARRTTTRVEVLVSDCKGDYNALDLVVAERPDVFNHNIETVSRLQRAVRPSAGYARSLGVLAHAADAGLVVKSGLMVGLGETEEEVVATLADLAAVGVSIATIGQYLRPSAAHLPVARYYEPEVFERLADLGQSLGLAHVEASPLTRSSYHARQAAEAMTEGAALT